MKNLNYWLDLAKEKSGSDYRTAKIIGMTRQGISAARNRQAISSSNAAKLADYLGVDPIKIIAAADVDKNPENAKIWSKWVAASVILTLGITTGYQGISTGYADIAFYNSIDYAQLAVIALSGLIVAGSIYMLRRLKE